MWAKLGGFAMIASATKGLPESWSASMHAFQQPSIISSIIALFFWISPERRASMLGNSPGFLTIYYKRVRLEISCIARLESLTAIKAAGSPPIGKNSKSALVTKDLNVS